METPKDNEGLDATVVKLPGVGPKNDITTDTDNEPVMEITDESIPTKEEQELALQTE